jgi:hypothetical protein
MKKGFGGPRGTTAFAALLVVVSSLTASAIVLHRPMDFTGDGKSDFVMVRNTGGGPTGGITWFANDATSAAYAVQGWGIATDFFVPGDYDGDGKADYAIWRPGTGGTAGFWIVPSSTGVGYFVPFGQSGDDPTVIGDYDGDGKTDPAVYRGGATAGAPSFWWYKSSLTGTYVSTNWGQNGDFPAPGDYDGDGKNDFGIQRNGGGGSAIFWFKMATGAITSAYFGTPTDVIVPGDYDGDGKTDIATVRGASGSILWNVKRSSDGTFVSAYWGMSATDFPTQGDYDGDGKTDYAVWRPSATPGSSFYVLKAAGGTISRAWATTATTRSRTTTALNACRGGAERVAPEHFRPIEFFENERTCHAERGGAADSGMHEVE